MDQLTITESESEAILEETQFFFEDVDFSLILQTGLLSWEKHGYLK
jgi:hypothetical protein